MPHLQAKGNRRSLKFNPLTKAQKLQMQLQQTDERINKQNADKKRISEQLTILQTQDQEQI